MSASPRMPDILPDIAEAGTHNVCGIAGLAAGLEFVRRHGIGKIERHELRLRKTLERWLREDTDAAAGGAGDRRACGAALCAAGA